MKNIGFKLLIVCGLILAFGSPGFAWQGAPIDNFVLPDSVVDGDVKDRIEGLSFGVSPNVQLHYDGNENGTSYVLATFNNKGTKCYGTQFDVEAIAETPLNADKTAPSNDPPDDGTAGGWGSWTGVGGSALPSSMSAGT